MVRRWEDCFKAEYPLVRALKQSTKSPSVFEHFDVEYDFQRMGLEYYGGTQGKALGGDSNVISLSMLQVIEHNRRKSAKHLESFHFRLIPNAKGSVCASYPDKFLVPALLTDAQVKKICKFRSRERLPILTFTHENSEGAAGAPNCRPASVSLARVAGADRRLQQPLPRRRVPGRPHAQPREAQGAADQSYKDFLKTRSISVFMEAFSMGINQGDPSKIAKGGRLTQTWTSSTRARKSRSSRTK